MTVKLKATTREDLTKSATKEIRNSGRVPAVIYGKKKDSKSISVDNMELVKTVRDEGRNAIISLDVENDSAVDVMLHEYQIDPIKDELIHVDFYVVNMSEEMDVEVPLRLEGEAQGSKDGGVLQQPLYELQVRSKPANIPDEITVDVSSLGIGDSIAIADLPKAKNYEFLEDEETTIATVLAPDTLDDIEEATDENAEPELVGAKKDSDEE
ncbi:50S ribosomal protein L25/general stress protein Ctc [Virgibacillus profundi]|uniref:Large ribosomal subunit protein bL25 n=1 Tax=Virgibacillus profundi TaxID=2024555 RepID=A0A2A2IBA3_9BACI|nr:50S ribosomal protein L25/general stress protein Ctc [Virgibacillus profundi]PAV28564.1 50S ribosomal protein L25/general stress protein Ctc [Virgibacillus profundi]PXY52737.1 50S ribosomal protein L25/general stress protein Ctc [Virgibacillus profundi]